MSPDIVPKPDEPVAANHRWALLVCVMVGLLLRLGWGLHLPSDEVSLRALPDQMEYLNLARNWLSQATFFFHDDRFGQDVFAYRTPGYPALIALCAGSIRATRAAQAFLDAGTILGVWLLARRWLSDRASLVAAWIVCINPWLIFFSGLLLGETLFTALLVWGMWGIGRNAGRREDAKSAKEDAKKKNKFLYSFASVFASSRLIGFLLLSLTVLVRPSAILLPAMVVTLAAGRRTLLRGAIALLVPFLILFPWAMRNHARLGSWVWLSTNGGITLYDGFNPAADGASNQGFVKAMPQLAEMSEVARDGYFRQRALQFIQTNPSRVNWLAGRKILRTWSPIPLSETYNSQWRYVVLGAVYALPMFILVLAGLCSGSLGRTAKVFLLAPAIYITAVHAATVGSLRYRIPADVPMAIIAASVVKNRTTSNEQRAIQK